MGAAKDFGLGFKIPRAYRQAMQEPVDERKVVFLDPSRDTLPEAFSVMWERLEADPRFDVQFISLGKHRASMPRYLSNCVDAVREVATARLVFICDASDVLSCIPLRPETSIVQLWHGCGAFKKFGRSTIALSYGLTEEELARHPFYKNLSLVTVSSPEVEWAYLEAMGLSPDEDIVRPVGVSRTDVFFDGDFHERALRDVYAAVPQAANKRVVLYAPTFRGKLAHAHAPEMPDFEKLRAAIGDDSIVLVKHHPMVRSLPQIPSSCADFVFDVTGGLPIDELMTVADTLVTDYSSIVFEFSIFGRPMVFFAPDLKDYETNRDFYYDYEEMTPGPMAATTDELVDLLADTDRWFDADEVARFFHKFMRACDGHATDRILEAVGV